MVEVYFNSFDYQDYVLQPFPSDPNIRSYIGGISTTIFFVNDLPADFSAKIYSIDFEGQRILWGDSAGLRKSEHLEVTAYTHQPWEVVFSRQGETVTKIYYPHYDPSRVMLNASVFPPQVCKRKGLHLKIFTDIILQRLIGILPSLVREPQSFQETRSTNITFVNLLKIRVDVRWVGFYGRRQLYKTLLPGSSSTQPTYVGHVWEIVTADIERKPLVIFYAAPYDGLAEIDDSFLSEPTPA